MGSTARFEFDIRDNDVCGFTDLTNGACAFGYRCSHVQYQRCCFCTSLQELGQTPEHTSILLPLNLEEELIRDVVCDGLGFTFQ